MDVRIFVCLCVLSRGLVHARTRIVRANDVSGDNAKFIGRPTRALKCLQHSEVFARVLCSHSICFMCYGATNNAMPCSHTNNA